MTKIIKYNFPVLKGAKIDPHRFSCSYYVPLFLESLASERRRVLSFLCDHPEELVEWQRSVLVAHAKRIANVLNYFYIKRKGL